MVEKSWKDGWKGWKVEKLKKLKKVEKIEKVEKNDFFKVGKGRKNIFTTLG